MPYYSYMVATAACIAPVGFEGEVVDVETDIKRGLPGLQIVGMGNKAIDEAKERVRSAITNSYLDMPASRVTVNLAPAEPQRWLALRSSNCRLHPGGQWPVTAPRDRRRSIYWGAGT